MGLCNAGKSAPFGQGWGAALAVADRERTLTHRGAQREVRGLAAGHDLAVADAVELPLLGVVRSAIGALQVWVFVKVGNPFWQQPDFASNSFKVLV